MSDTFSTFSTFSPSMNLDQFAVFAAVAKHGNVTRAANELSITQPAVTKNLKLLEEYYKTKLYIRGGTGIELTPAEQLFWREVKTILSRVEALRAKLGGAGVTAGESLTVGGSFSPSASLLPSLLARFEKSHPEAELSLRTDSRAVVECLVLNGEVDLAVLNDPPSNRYLAMEPYRSEPVVAFVHPNHPLATKPHLDSEDLGRAGFVIRRRVGGNGTAARYLQNLRKNGVRVKVLMRCDSPEAVKAAVKKSLESDYPRPKAGALRPIHGFATAISDTRPTHAFVPVHRTGHPAYSSEKEHGRWDLVQGRCGGQLEAR